MSVRQIAKAAGLSPGAVSLALRGSPKIAPATRRRVGRIARRLGYRPDPGIAELMARVRSVRRIESCLGVISLYPEPRPWEKSAHLSAIHASMARRAGELGYRLEPLWLAAPGMTRRRICSILDARGIRGLLSFGGPDVAERFPAELDHYAVVTVGLSIQGPIHRVTSHFFADTMATLDRLAGLGYRRPGLLIGRHEEARSAGAPIGAYLAWWERRAGEREPPPVLRVDGLEESALVAWRARHRPDAIVCVHLSDLVRRFGAFVRRRFEVPGRLGVAALTHRLDGTGLSGMQQDQEQMGVRAVELLVARILHGDFGIPAHPRTELVESRWVDGGSLRPSPA